MYQTLIFYHSFLRWIVLVGILLVLFRSQRGHYKGLDFSKTDNSFRHWTATLAHIQLLVGMLLYFQSPSVQYVLANFSSAKQQFELLFFGVLHPLSMLFAIVLVTLGSAFAKRKTTAAAKHKTLVLWYGLAIVVIIATVPWPFSPLTQRPYLR